jgi:hypothetical protein
MSITPGSPVSETPPQTGLVIRRVPNPSGHVLVLWVIWLTYGSF